MTTRRLFLSLFVACLGATSASANESVARLRVGSSGRQTGPVYLQRGETYVIVARQYVYFGRWWRNSQSLLDDACFEFNATANPRPSFLPVLKNNLGIAVCDGQYNGAHIYRSQEFTASGDPLHFHIEDTDYRDNRGSLEVEVYRVSSASGDMEWATNRQGGDYRSFALDSDAWSCRAACMAEGQCRAFTYVAPGVQGARARCWLKNSVPSPTRNRDCASGVVR
jgi:hypothetical protein